MSQPATSAKSDIETSTIRTISWRLIPFLVLAYFFSYLDRVNLGFAALTMNADLKFTPLVFAWGAGIFFIGYFLFEVPSNLALEKFGAHLCRVLDAADGVALRYGRGRRHRADQFDRQPRGFRRALSDWLDEGSDRQHVDGIAGAVAIAACGRAARLPRRSRDKDRVRRGEVAGSPDGAKRNPGKSVRGEPRIALRSIRATRHPSVRGRRESNYPLAKLSFTNS